MGFGLSDKNYLELQKGKKECPLLPLLFNIGYATKLEKL